MLIARLSPFNALFSIILLHVLSVSRQLTTHCRLCSLCAWVYAIYPFILFLSPWMWDSFITMSAMVDNSMQTVVRLLIHVCIHNILRKLIIRVISDWKFSCMNTLLLLTSTYISMLHLKLKHSIIFCSTFFAIQMWTRIFMKKKKRENNSIDFSKNKFNPVETNVLFVSLPFARKEQWKKNGSIGGVFGFERFG